MRSSFLISIVRPSGYAHADAFKELAETLMFGLRRLGYAAIIRENQLSTESQTILLGANLLGPELIYQLPPSTIIYNLEQIDPQSDWLKGSLLVQIR